MPVCRWSGLEQLLHTMPCPARSPALCCMWCLLLLRLTPVRHPCCPLRPRRRQEPAGGQRQGDVHCVQRLPPKLPVQHDCSQAQGAHRQQARKAALRAVLPRSHGERLSGSEARRSRGLAAGGGSSNCRSSPGSDPLHSGIFVTPKTPPVRQASQQARQHCQLCIQDDSTSPFDTHC